jgi:hypothetical protein
MHHAVALRMVAMNTGSQSSENPVGDIIRRQRELAFSMRQGRGDAGISKAVPIRDRARTSGSILSCPGNDCRHTGGLTLKLCVERMMIMARRRTMITIRSGRPRTLHSLPPSQQTQDGLHGSDAPHRDLHRND